MDFIENTTFSQFMSTFVVSPDSADERSPNTHSTNVDHGVPPDFGEGFGTVPATRDKESVYAIVAKAINTSGIARTMRATSGKRAKTAVSGLYSRPSCEGRPGCSWGYLELPILSYSPGDDPFSPDESISVCGRENKSSFFATAAHVLARQHRTHVFILILVGQYFRLVRIDRGLLAVTHALPYTNNPHALGDFIWGFSALPPTGRGHDPTVELVPRGSDMEKVMLDAAALWLPGAAEHARRLFFYSMSDRSWPRWILTVDEAGKAPQRFLVAKPHFVRYDLGDPRGVRGYVAIALDAPGQPFVYMKDAWRWERHNTPSEGAVLAYLNAKGVRNVPTLLCYGDVPRQRVDVGNSLEKLRRRQCNFGRSIVHAHYRMAVREVGEPLSAFGSGRELVQIIRDSVVAHRDAYVLAKLLHCDISTGNVLIVPYDDADGKVQRRGMLMDWELSERVDLRDGLRGGGGFLKGTRPFLSVRLLSGGAGLTQVPDELEAFLHVVVNMGLRYISNDCADRAGMHDAYFDPTNKATHCTTLKQRCVVEGVLLTHENRPLSFRRARGQNGPHPIQAVLEEILAWTKARYNARPCDDETTRVPQPEDKENESPARRVGSSPAKEPFTSHTRGRTPLVYGTTNTAAKAPTGREKFAADECDGDLSSRLDHHEPLIRLLDASLEEFEWPEGDKRGAESDSESDSEVGSSYSSCISGEDSGSWESSSGSESDSGLSEASWSDAKESLSTSRSTGDPSRLGKHGRSDEESTDDSDASLAKRVRRL